ncbi:hypothetical protein EUTSA_v10027478mg [Eutrema salsugineum]|uniref:Uncharacterized protein n=1 Tax=Eutrema salsugineum TaxID=72664 RepID=V4MP83_EUTSA|nr:protein SINE4 [Eutrema salsugineum]ESQ54818.1 hypothetical protein EUTSA_v10027478mg [Eutrema salsugineum]
MKREIKRREVNPHERLKQQLSELEQEWTAMKAGKSSSADSCITVEEALELVENSPRKLMLSLQNEQACPEAEMVPQRSPCRRKLFHDSDDDEDKWTSLSHSPCWSSNVMRVTDNNNNSKKKQKKRGNIVYVSMMLVLLLVLVVLMNGFDHLSMNRQIDTLVPT